MSYIKACYLVHLCLRSLLQRVQYHIQIFLKLPSDGQSDVTEHGEDLRLHGPVHILILHTHTGKCKHFVYNYIKYSKR